MIANNATGKGSAAARGRQFGAESCCCPASALWPAAAASFARVLQWQAGRYNRAAPAQTTARHARFDRAPSIDGAVGAVLRILKPLGIEAAVKATETQTNRTSVAQRHEAIASTGIATRLRMPVGNTDAVDPRRIAVAAGLERRWNDER